VTSNDVAVAINEDGIGKAELLKPIVLQVRRSDNSSF
jgi:hypothetical protein